MTAVVVRGVRLELHPSPDYVSDRIRETRDFYEADILDEVRRRVTGGVLVDVGAMIGNHSAYLAAFVPHSAIHAFEPIPDNVDLLVGNVAPWPSVSVDEVALSDHEGTARMVVEHTNYGHARIPRVGGLVDVKTRTLDSYRLDDVTLLKIDVEGHEPQVLAGARDTIARCRPLIVIEDWPGTYAELLPGYRLAVSWAEAHQTYLYEPIT